MPTPERQPKPLPVGFAFHLGSRALQQLPFSKLRAITQIQRNGIRHAEHTRLPRGRETRPGKSALLTSLGTIHPGVRMGGSQKGGGERTGGILPAQEKRAGFPGHGKQPVLSEKKRQTEREGPQLGKAEERHFSGSRLEPVTWLPGEVRSVPSAAEGDTWPAKGAAEEEQSFACRTPESCQAGAVGPPGGGRGAKGVEMGFPPLGRALVEEAPGQPRAACFRLRSRDPAARTGSAEPRSARRTGPSIPGGQRLWLRGRWGPTPHGACPSSPGNTREHPDPQQALRGCKIHPSRSPSSVCPSSRGRREGPPGGGLGGERNLRQVEDSGHCGSPPGPPSPGLPVRTPTRI